MNKGNSETTYYKLTPAKDDHSYVLAVLAVLLVRGIKVFKRSNESKRTEYFVSAPYDTLDQFKSMAIFELGSILEKELEEIKKPTSVFGRWAFLIALKKGNMNMKAMNYFDYKERFFKGERFEEIFLTFPDLKVKNQYLKDLLHFGKVQVQKDLPLSTQTSSVFGDFLKTLETQLSEDEKMLLKRPVDEDTSIVDIEFILFRECTALFEYWSWDGCWGGSLIILKKDVPSDNSEGFIRSLLSQLDYPADQPFTSKENGEYFFINYNFHVSEK